MVAKIVVFELLAIWGHDRHDLITFGAFSVPYDGQITKIISQPHTASLCIMETTSQIGSDT